MDAYGAIASIPLILIAVLIAVWTCVIYRRDLAIQRTNAQLYRPPEPWRPSAPPIELAELESLIATTPALALHCWAIWNGADRMMDRSWADVMPRWSGRIVLRSFDVDPPEHEQWLHQRNVNNVPATVLFRDGRHVGTRCYLMSPADLHTWLIEAFGEPAK